MGGGGISQSGFGGSPSTGNNAPLSQPDMSMPTGNQQASNAYSYTAPQNLSGGQQPFSQAPSQSNSYEMLMQQANQQQPIGAGGMPPASGKMSQAPALPQNMMNSPQFQMAIQNAIGQARGSMGFKRGGAVKGRKLTTKEMDTLTQALAIAKRVMAK